MSPPCVHPLVASSIHLFTYFAFSFLFCNVRYVLHTQILHSTCPHLTPIKFGAKFFRQNVKPHFVEPAPFPNKFPAYITYSMCLKSVKVSTKGMPLNTFPTHALQGAAVSTNSTALVVLASPFALTSPPKVIWPLHCPDFSPKSSGSSREPFPKGSCSFSPLLMLIAATPKGFSSAGIQANQGGTLML